MKIAIIAAISENGVIGHNNTLPWYLPADLKHFKTITEGKPIIMGRKTYESIGKPLPNRTNIIVTRNSDYKAPGCLTVKTLEGALALAKPAEEIFIIGGSSLFAEALPIATHFYLTEIHASFSGDTFFPPWNKEEWIETQREDHFSTQDKTYSYSFVTLIRKDT